MNERYRRTDPRRYVVIVNSAGEIVARQEAQEPARFPDFADKLPGEFVALLNQAAGEQTHMVGEDLMVHIVPFKGTGGRLRALIFEELRVRATP